MMLSFLIDTTMTKERLLQKRIEEVIILMKIVMAYLIMMKMLKILNFSWHMKMIP